MAIVSIGIERSRQVPAPPRGILGLPGRLAFTVRRWEPSDHLAWCVERFWTSSWDLPGDRAAVTRILPHPCVNLTLEHHQLRVTGVPHGVFNRRLTGQDQVFGVKFTPGSFRLLIDSSVVGLSGTGESAHDLLPDSRALEQALDQAVDDDQRALVVETYLSRRGITPDPSSLLVRTAVDALVTDVDIRRVGDLSEQLRVSDRTLQRLFAEYVGVSPGWVLRRGRLHAAAERVIELAASGQPGGLADVAAEFGYADQAHFTRDFRSVLGVSPASWAATLISEEPPA